jgi:ATP adenylyltransferase
MKYITSAKKKSDECVFCEALNSDPAKDRENLVVYRGKTVFVIMNLYPYNTGHMMIIPQPHAATLAQVLPETQFELIRLTSYFTELLTQVMRPDGFNIGLNIGRAAGAGIDDHLHVHVVPRWSGDSNFMTIVGETRVLPEELGDTYDRIVALLKKQPPGL